MRNRGKLDFGGKLVACNVETGIYLAYRNKASNPRLTSPLGQGERFSSNTDFTVTGHQAIQRQLAGNGRKHRRRILPSLQELPLRLHRRSILVQRRGCGASRLRLRVNDRV
jgi:hypothetical protein